MERLSLPVRFKNGLRVTDEAGLELTTMVLRGAVSASLASALNRISVPAVGMSGIDGGLLRAEPHEDPELGFVGQAGDVDARLLDTLMGAGFVPLVAPLAVDGAGQLRNLNGDTVCGALAGALTADLVVFLTDVAGVLDADGVLIPRLDTEQIAAMITAGQIRGGMIPKVQACLAALRYGARQVCIADGRRSDLLPGYAHNHGIPGTIVTM
jgi:acetylglutamate kinase